MGGICATLAVASQVAACSTVPPLSHVTSNAPFGNNIKVDDIVQRVKCEVADALDKKVEKKRFKWLESWTVKTDLTLQVNETGGLTPSATFVQPLQNAFPLGSGPSSVAFPKGTPGASVNATPQNFNLGFGGTFTEQVFRTETVSFALSVRELKQWREEGPGKDLPCRPAGYTDLQGDLDLGSWLEEALRPVAAGHLELGIHPVGAGSAPISHGIVPLAEDAAFILYYRKYIKNSADDATKSAQQADATRLDAARSGYISDSYKGQIGQFAKKAAEEAVEANRLYCKSLTKMLDGEGAQGQTKIDCPEGSRSENVTRENLKTFADNAGRNAEAAAYNAALAKLYASPNFPIESLAHSLNFIVTAGVNASPNWVLLHWKGPTNLGNLASYTGIRTHTLSIALGAGTAEATRLLNNQAFRQAIQGP
jgi:hypothetical protein